MARFSIFIVLIFLTKSYANNVGIETGFELPRYASLKLNESNLRVGPSTNYPILIKYIKKDIPVKIIDEYKDWRKIIDSQSNTGWLHKRLIKGERYGIIELYNKEKVFVYNVVGGKVIGEIYNGSVIFLSRCKINWCLIHKNKNKGWVKKEYIWGVKINEQFNINFTQIFFDNIYISFNFIEKSFSSN